MNDTDHWSPDHDPPRDETFTRLLRAADAREADERWARLHAAIMRRATGAGRPGSPERAWWDVVLEWRRVAVAASVAAMLAAGALLWRAGTGGDDLALGAGDAPESVALARVVAAYPDDAVLTSLIQTAGSDELAGWESR